MSVYLKKLSVNDPSVFERRGPLLLACNHPNSFLDAIIFSVLFKQPVHSLARGDAFKGKWVKRVLHLLHMLPVYRTSEGVENLEHNYDTFAACLEIFKAGGIVLIFSEGLCINEWHLRPLKKGTARLATSAWNNGIDLCVLPVGLNYHSFKSAEKIVAVNFGTAITQGQVSGESEGKKLVAFNTVLAERLSYLVFEIKASDSIKAVSDFKYKENIIEKIFLAVPALVGQLIHYPIIFVLRTAVIKKTKVNGHTDSIFFGWLFIFYPIYLSILVAISIFLLGSWGWLALVFIPFSAWCRVQSKKTKYFAE